jgi:transcriptional regulator with XRE-family HTH domain
VNKIRLMYRPRALTRDLASHSYSSWLNFHQSLIEIRIAKGLTQADVAQQLGISQPAVSQFESLSRLPNLQTVFLYALVVGAKLDFSISES